MCIFFSISALSPQPDQDALNLFMQQHRVVAVEKQWLADGALLLPAALFSHRVADV